GTIIGDNNTIRRPDSSDSDSSIEITGTGQRNHHSFLQVNLNVEEARRLWGPTTVLLLQTHLNFKRAYLEAQAGSNHEEMAILRKQAITTHNRLERLIGPEFLRVEAEGCNP
ncbi:hypothetical protein PTTG_29504, partial [Puccinia triticina 1-1 BBBD Race 1]